MDSRRNMEDRQTRAETSRAASSRSGANEGRISALHLDPGHLDPKFDYLWVREYALNLRDRANVEARLNDDGFDPVEASEAPSLRRRDLADAPKEDQYIRHGGLVLCKRPRERAAEARDAHRRETAERIRAVDNERKGKLDGRNFRDINAGGVVGKRAKSVSFEE